MTRRHWSKGILILASLLLFAGVFPPAWLLWFGYAHNFAPLSMPITLQRGEIVSPFFTTDLNDSYQIDFDWAHGLDQPIDPSLDWRIVDAHSSVISQGSFAQHLPGGNEVHLGFYKPKRGLRQRIILDIHTDIQGANAAHPTLNIGVPEEGLDMAYAWPAVLPWSGIFCASGLVGLIVALALRRPPQN
jgi:hypothetical protein